MLTFEIFGDFPIRVGFYFAHAIVWHVLCNYL